MAQLPNIVIHGDMVKHVKQHQARFGSIDVQLADPWCHMRLANPHGDLVSFFFADTTSCTQDKLEQLHKELITRETVQKYIIISPQFALAKLRVDAYTALASLDYRIIWAPYIMNGIEYACGLIEKGCKHGFYGVEW